MRKRALLTALIVITSMGTVPGTAVADDEWSDNCSDAETITPGTYSGNLSPEDTDAFRVKLSEGDFINGTLSYDIDRVGGITLWPYPEPGGEPFASEFSITIESEGYDSPQSDIDVEDYDRADDNPARFRLYNEGPKDEVYSSLAKTHTSVV